jgi:hypothetical protein
MKSWSDGDIELYSSLFNIAGSLVGCQVKEVLLYLDSTDFQYSEQPNKYGKSLLNGFDLVVNDKFYAIGNRFTDSGYGLMISKGRTSDLEYIDEGKEPIVFPANIVSQVIMNVSIYWMKIPVEGATGYYPQEIEISTTKSYFLISSIEVNQGEVNTEFTNEILLIEDRDIARKLKLGEFGLLENDRKLLKTFEDLKRYE